MSCLSKRCSSRSASTASRTFSFRPRVRFGDRRLSSSLATCCVIVDPPSTICRSARLLPHRAQHRDGIDAGMRPEPPILGGKRRRDEQRRQPIGGETHVARAVAGQRFVERARRDDRQPPSTSCRGDRAAPDRSGRAAARGRARATAPPRPRPPSRLACVVSLTRRKDLHRFTSITCVCVSGRTLPARTSPRRAPARSGTIPAVVARTM